MPQYRRKAVASIIEAEPFAGGWMTHQTDGHHDFLTKDEFAATYEPVSEADQPRTFSDGVSIALKMASERCEAGKYQGCSPTAIIGIKELIPEQPKASEPAKPPVELIDWSLSFWEQPAYIRDQSLLIYKVAQSDILRRGKTDWRELCERLLKYQDLLHLAWRQCCCVNCEDFRKLLAEVDAACAKEGR